MRSHIAPLTEEPPPDETGAAGAGAAGAGAAGAGAAGAGRDMVPTARMRATGAVTTCELAILSLSSLPLTQVRRWLTTLRPCWPAVTVFVVPVYMLESLRWEVPNAMASLVATIFCVTR